MSSDAYSSSYYRPVPGADGPSWLSVIGHAKDSLWSVDLLRCESILLRSFWVMVVMDVFTRRIIGFGIAAANLDGPVVCRMFNRVDREPRYLSSDHDPLVRFHRWLANLRVLQVDEIKAISCTCVWRIANSLRKSVIRHTHVQILTASANRAESLADAIESRWQASALR